MTDDNREKFLRLADSYGQLVKFYNVEELCAEKIAEFRQLTPNSWATIGCLFKFLISKVIPIEIQKIIYLDADIIVNLDIAELWQIDLDKYPLAGVPEIFNGINTAKQFLMVADGLIKAEDYFNSGVLLMNLKSLRKEDHCIIKGIKFREENPRQRYWDQTVWNYCFSTRTLHLPKKFNRFAYNASLENNAVIEKNIYHYVPKPHAFNIDMNNPFNRLWWGYFIKTPWFDVDTINNILKGATESMLKLSALSHGKRRIFIVDAAHARQIERNFSVRDEEEVIVVDVGSEESLVRLTDLMSRSRDKNIFFIGIPNIDSKLLKMGFARGKDFFNVCGFYSPIWADLTSNYNLIFSM